MPESHPNDSLRLDPAAAADYPVRVPAMAGEPSWICAPSSRQLECLQREEDQLGVDYDHMQHPPDTQEQDFRQPDQLPPALGWKSLSSSVWGLPPQRSFVACVRTSLPIDGSLNWLLVECWADAAELRLPWAWEWQRIHEGARLLGLRRIRRLSFRQRWSPEARLKQNISMLVKLRPGCKNQRRSHVNQATWS